MSMKICPICDADFEDGDKIVAVVLSEFHKIDSDVNIAIDHPERCLEITHRECYDYEEFGGDEEREGD
jgi:hypothetical protein